MGNPNNTIRLNLELDDRKAQQNAKKFVSQLETNFNNLQKQLNQALAQGVSTPQQQQNIRKLTAEVKKAERELNSFSKALLKTEKQAEDTSDAVGDTVSTLSSFGVSLRRIAGLALAGFGLSKIAQGFISLSRDAFIATSQLEQTENALRSLVARELVTTGDFENLNDALDAANPRAEELLQFVRNLAKESPFGREQIQAAFQTALAYGFTTEEAQRLTTATVDLAAASGRGAESVGRIALALGQIQAKGKVSAEELNQLREAGFDANQALADLGFTLDDVTKGLVDSDSFIEAAVTRLEKDFGGAAAQATNSLMGLTSTLGDLRSDALVAFFRPALEILQPALIDFVGGVEDSIPQIEELGESAGRAFGAMAEILPSVTTTVRILNETLGFTADRLEELNDLTGGQEDNFREVVAAQLEGIEAQERINRLLEARQELGIVSDLAGFDDVLQEEIRQATIELLRSAETTAEAQEILNKAFGDSVAQVETSLGKGGAISGLFVETENGAIRLGDSIEDLVEVSQRFSSSVKEGSNTALAQREALKELSSETDSISEKQQRLTEQNILLAEAEREAAEAAIIQEEANRDLIVSAVEAVGVTDATTKAIFDQAEEAGATSEQLSALAFTLGILSPAQVEAKAEQDALTQAFLAGEVGADVFAQRSRELANVLSNEVTQSAIDAGEAINSALSGASARLDEITALPTGGGGGRQRDIAGELQNELTEIADDLADEITDIQTEADEEITDIQKANDEEVAELERGLIDGTSEIAERREDELKALRLENDKEVAEANRQFDEERANRLAEFERQRAETFVTELANIQSEEPQAVTREEQLRDVAGGAPTAEAAATIFREGDLATEEEIDAALREELRERGQESIKQALRDGLLAPEDVDDAIDALNEQLAAGAENIDLSAFGVAIRDAAAIELEVEEERQAALSEIRTQFLEQEERIRLNAQIATQERIAELNKRSAEEVAAIQERTAERIATANEKAAERVETANTRAAKAIEQAQTRGGRAARSTTEALKIQRSQQILNLAAQTEDLVQKRELAQLAFQQLADAGIISQVEADRQTRLFELNEISAALAQSQQDVNTAIDDGESSLTNNQQTLDLLATDLFDSAENARALAQVLRSDQIPAFTELINEGVPLRDVLDQIGVNLDELPEEVQVAIGTNADEALTEINDVDTALDELDGKEVTARVNVEADERVAGGGGGVGASGAGQQAPGDAFQSGGFTGRGATNDVAGIVHANELVVLEAARKSGIAGIIQFALARDPDIAMNTRNSTPATPSSVPFNPSIAPSITNISNTSSGDTISNTDNSSRVLTINGADDRQVRSVIDFEQLDDISKLMRRG